MSRAYWVICHRSTRSLDKFAAFTKLAFPAIQAAGGRFLARTSTPARVYERGLIERTVLIEFEGLATALAAYHTPSYKEALRALGDGAERDLRIVEGIDQEKKENRMAKAYWVVCYHSIKNPDALAAYAKLAAPAIQAAGGRFWCARQRRRKSTSAD